MKTSNFLFLLVISYFLVNCDDSFLETGDMPMEEIEEDAVAYPLLYKYPGFENGIKFNPTEFYRYQVDDFEQIEILSGDYLLTDSFFFAEFYDVNNEEALVDPFPLQEVEMLSDTLVRLRFEGTISTSSQVDSFFLDSTFVYQKEENNLLIDFGGSLIKLHQMEDFTQLKSCFQIYGFNYYSEFYERRTQSGFDGGDCEFDDVNDLLLDIVERFSDSEIQIQKNDTFLVNISYNAMDLSE